MSMVRLGEEEASIYGQFQGFPATIELLMRFKESPCRICQGPMPQHKATFP